jgi:hypothetical protein
LAGERSYLQTPRSDSTIKEAKGHATSSSGWYAKSHAELIGYRRDSQCAKQNQMIQTPLISLWPEAK